MMQRASNIGFIEQSKLGAEGGCLQGVNISCKLVLKSVIGERAIVKQAILTPLQSSAVQISSKHETSLPMNFDHITNTGRFKNYG